MVDYYHAVGVEQVKWICDWAKKYFGEKGRKLNMLVSFLEFDRRRDGVDYVKIWKENDIGKMFLDSGAFTYLAGAKKDENIVDELEILFEKYLDFLLKYADLFDVYVEFDVQEVLGIDRVEEMRDVFKEHGLKPLYGWHGEDFDTLLEWTERTDYVGFPARDEDEAFETIRRLRDVDDEVKVHLFGGTISERIYEYGITSCDSTASLKVLRFGEYILFRDGRLDEIAIKERIEFEDVVRDYEGLCNEFGIDVRKLVNGDRVESFKFNVVMVEEYKRYLDEMFDEKRKSGKKGKGAKKVKKGFGCKVCMYAERCPVHDEMSDGCQLLDKEWNELISKIGGIENFDGLLRHLIEEKTKRYLIMRIGEKLKGTVSRDTSRMENEIFDMVERYVRMKSEKPVELKGENVWEKILQEMQKVK